MTNTGNTKRTVPYFLIKEWADTEGRVKSVTRENEEFEILGAEEVFTEEYTGEGNPAAAADGVFSDVIGKIIRGKEVDSLLTLTTAILLTLSLYGKIPPVPARKDGGPEDPEKRLGVVFPYLMDLKYAVLEAPGGNSFVLADHPLYMDNILFPEKKDGWFDPLYRRGVLCIVPLTPVRALMLFDSSSYWLHGKDGRIVLTWDDVSRINRYTMERSERALVTPEKDGYSPGRSPEYYRDYFVDYSRYGTTPFSFISVKPEAEENGKELRPCMDSLSCMDYLRPCSDSRKPAEEESVEERIGRALLMLKEKGEREDNDN